MNIESQKIMSQSHVGPNWIHRVGKLRPKQGIQSMALESGLTLTSLVDAFTIMVIYLLVATNIGAPDVSVRAGIELPVASHAVLAQPATTVVYDSGSYYIDEAKVSKNQLVEKLSALLKSSKEKHLTVQADKKAEFEDLNPVVLAGLQAGFEEVRFAVIQEPGK